MGTLKEWCKVSWRSLFGLLWPAVLLPLLVCSGTSESRCAYVLLLMAGYFTCEPIPLAASALIPVFMFPMMGILSTTQTCYQYMKDTIMMYMGGLLFAAAVEHSNLHKRIALKVLLSLGTSPRWIMLSFMVTTMFLSMWITNTATTAMMVPIVEAVISELKKEFLLRQELKRKKMNFVPNICQGSLESLAAFEEKLETRSTTMLNYKPERSNDKSLDHIEDENVQRMLSSLQTALLLTLAFAASFGGIGTLIGSGPNLVLKSQMDEMFPDYKHLNFSTWMMYNIPGMVVGTFLLWILFQLFYVPCCKKSSEDSQAEKQIVKEVIQRNYEELGPLTFHEAAVMGLFTTLVFLWLMREPQFTTGWADLLPNGSNIKDATAAIGMSLFLFMVPSRPKQGFGSPPLLDWKTAQAKIPWGVLVLLGGGIALAKGTQASGLSLWISEALHSLHVLNPDVTAVILCLLTSFLTEFISNMSMATIMLPVVAQMALAAKVHPLLYMLPVTIACSFAFMLPVGNPSNAIVFDSGQMTTMQMVKPGIVVKIMACTMELILTYTLGISMFDLHSFPDWANSSREFFVSIPSVNEQFTLLSNISALASNSTLIS